MKSYIFIVLMSFLGNLIYPQEAKHENLINYLNH